MRSGHELRRSNGDAGLATAVSDAIKTVREARDSASERSFDLIYGTPPWPNASRAGES